MQGHRVNKRLELTSSHRQQGSQSGKGFRTSSSKSIESPEALYGARADRERINEPTSPSSPRAALAQLHGQHSETFSNGPADDVSSLDDASQAQDIDSDGSSNDEGGADSRHETGDCDTSAIPDMGCLWRGAKARPRKSKDLNGPVLEHVKRILAAQVIAGEVFTSPWPGTTALSYAMKEEWEKYVKAGQKDGTLNRDKYDLTPTPDEAKKVS
jgi:hypothetical protein